MKIAIVCDWLTNFAGSEQVVKALHELYPEAPIYTSVYNPAKMPEFKDAKIITSFIQKIPKSKTRHQAMFPLMPLAFEQFDFSGFDVVISSSHSCAKGIITKPQTLHICYCHTPTRYLWSNYHEYKKESNFNFLINKTIPSLTNYLRMWDILASDRVDKFIANSHFTARRIKKYYNKDSEVIYPPCDTGNFKPSTKIENYFLTVSRLIPYKRIDIIVKAFNDLKLPLKIVGRGPEFKKLKKIAKLNIEFLDEFTNENLREVYSRARAFVFAAEEDFGIVPLEAMAAGRPVIAYKSGGALESVIEGITGTFFEKQTTQCLSDTVKKFRAENYNPKVIRQHALTFDKAIFKRKIKDFVEKSYNEYIEFQGS